MSYSGEYEPGTVVVSTRERRLYYVLGEGKPFATPWVLAAKDFNGPAPRPSP